MILEDLRKKIEGRGRHFLERRRIEFKFLNLERERAIANE
jgi:hypothetical protein